MSTLFNDIQFHKLRSRFTFIAYQSYSFSIDEGKIRIRYLFNLSDIHRFEPQIEIPLRSFYRIDQLSNADLEAFIFNIGMIELISYWKCACPPKVIIKAFHLDEDQINWWKKLYFNGLGEFFYTNGIETNQEEFMEIIPESDKKLSVSQTKLTDGILVPIGGGKDSIVSLELLRKTDYQIIPLIVNPRGATINTIETAGFRLSDCVIINRSIDPLLIKLNQEGFLNGHTPFSALLAFVGVLASQLTGFKHIALSNESSANESTVINTQINHQYSKSIDFERDFRNYSRQFLHPVLNYFSLLRPLNELQIGKLFSGNKQYFNIFRSCNVGSKSDSWCGNCPKCLFTYLMLVPHLPLSTVNQIFGKDLSSNEQLVPVLKELRGKSETKPFECVGTVEEVEAAVQYILDRNPVLQNTILFKEIDKFGPKESNFRILLETYNHEHFLLPEYEKIVKDALYASENH
ncbi:MAG: hypothetical protein ACOYN5_05340 [Bacteroidales bacterium]